MSKKKDDKRGQIPRMKDLTFEQQNELMQRWRLRHDLRTAYPEIVDALIQWVIDTPDIAEFVSAGHKGKFHMSPSADLVSRLEANGFSDEEIQAALKSDEVAADWMTPEETATVLEHIARMQVFFDTHDPGPAALAVRIYQLLGEVIREEFIAQYGYAPEDSPTQRVKITGSDSELKKLRPTNHQPKLFGEGESSI